MYRYKDNTSTAQVEKDITPILMIDGVTINFGGLRALDNVNIEVASEEIVGLIGPNGSGKSTLLNVITGLYISDSGRVCFRRRDITGLTRQERKWRGISRTFQNIRLFSNMSVIENVMVALNYEREIGVLSSILRLPRTRKKLRELERVAFEALEFFGPRLTEWRDEPAASLSYANRRRLEIARAMVSNPDLLLLDEPTAGMNPAESLEMLDKIFELRKKGITIIIIEHDMDVIMSVSDHIVVLDEGKKIAEGKPEEIQGDERMIAAYLGKRRYDSAS